MNETEYEIDDNVSMPEPQQYAWGKAPAHARPRSEPSSETSESKPQAEIKSETKPEEKKAVSWGAKPKTTSTKSSGVTENKKRQSFEEKSKSALDKVEIDDDVPMPSSEQNASDYSAMLDAARKRTYMLSGGYSVWFEPTVLGSEKFGWKRELLSYKLFSFHEAKQVQINIALAEFGPDFKLYGTVGFVKLENGEMGGTYNYVFDASQFTPEQIGSAHPPGTFNFQISDVSLDPNSKGTGMNFMVEFATDAGSIKKYYSLFHENQDTARKAHNQLSALCHAVKIQHVDMNNGGRALIGGRGMIEVGPQTSGDGAEKGYMEIKKVMDVNGNAPGRNNPNPGTQQTASIAQQNVPAGFGSTKPSAGGFGGAQGAWQQQGGGFGAPNGGGQSPSGFGAPQSGFGGGAQQQPQSGFGGQPQQNTQTGFAQNPAPNSDAPSWAQNR